jgi:hypothetical protein
MNDSYWIAKNRYYYNKLSQFYKFIIPPQSKVLQIGCKSGFLLNSVDPLFGLGIDENLEYIQEAKEKYQNKKNLSFECKNIYDLSKNNNKHFEYIIISHTLMREYDIQVFLETVQNFCNAKTRIIINVCSWLWEPIINLGQRLKLCRKDQFKNWVQISDIKNFLKLTEFETISTHRRTLIPKNIPIIAPILNKIISNIPLVDFLCIDQFVITRSIKKKIAKENLTCSVIIPCRNEKGNIESAIKQIPQMGKHTEIIFVEGHSQDETLEEVKKRCARTKRENFSFKYTVQPGTGKADAVKTGFAMATGNVLMILDADLTVPPEELTKFWQAISQGKGEFINGVRLVYEMESQAMMRLNLIANKLLSIGFSWLFNQNIKDTLCGTKVLFKSDWEKILKQRKFLGNSDPFGDFDLIFGAVKQNLKLIDIPVHYKDRTYGSTQIRRFWHGMILIKMCFIGALKFRIFNR